jgi:hypothetical protein
MTIEELKEQTIRDKRGFDAVVNGIRVRTSYTEFIAGTQRRHRVTFYVFNGKTFQYMAEGSAMRYVRENAKKPQLERRTRRRSSARHLL